MVRRSISYRNLSVGLYLLSIGLFKKVVLADHFGEWANEGFNASGQLNFLYAWVTSLCYTFQIYFDFSGYTDMALGAASMFNIRLPFNFASPYKALDPQDFWRRWHITLGRFLRDYVYIPLGGSRVGDGRVYLNLMITFLICGTWHGASWTFIVWGLVHGAALVVHSLWKKTGRHLPIVIAWLLTFTFVNAAWVLFRAPHDGRCPQGPFSDGRREGNCPARGVGVCNGLPCRPQRAVRAMEADRDGESRRMHLDPHCPCGLPDLQELERDGGGF